MQEIKLKIPTELHGKGDDKHLEQDTVSGGEKSSRSKSYLGVISTGLDDGLDTAGEEKEYDDSCFLALTTGMVVLFTKKSLEETTLMGLTSSVLDMLRFKIFVFCFLFVCLVVLFS